MSNSPLTCCALGAAPRANDRFLVVDQSTDLSALAILQPGEAFTVPTFEVAESLIARGVDSARIAVRQGKSLEESYCGSFPAVLDEPLVPLTPFRFDPSILIVLPTYNERPNLIALIETIRKYLLADVLIVDDNSPDGTGQLADELSRREPWAHVLHRPSKKGLGPAYVAGFQWALARGYELIIEMDCDFSHPPWDLPRLVHESRNADLVLGSRYVPGGGTQNWDMRRRVVSRLGNGYVRMFLGADIHDWTGGFRCYHRDLLTQIDLAGVKAKGYVFQVEMTWRARLLGASISELPIRFTDRIHGQSKLGWQSIIEAITEIPKMRAHTASSGSLRRTSVSSAQ